MLVAGPSAAPRYACATAFTIFTIFTNLKRVAVGGAGGLALVRVKGAGHGPGCLCAAPFTPQKTKLASAMEPRAPRSLPPFRQWRGVEEVDPVNPWRGYTQN